MWINISMPPNPTAPIINPQVASFRSSRIPEFSTKHARRLPLFLKFSLVSLVLVGLPLLGVFLAGYPISQYQ